MWIARQVHKRSSPRGSGLRNETRHRPVAVADADMPARAELDPIVVDAEEQGAIEASISMRIVELVTGAVHVQFLPMDKPVGMSQNDGTDGEQAEAKFVRVEALV